MLFRSLVLNNGTSYLWVGFTLRCFQRLSDPYIVVTEFNYGREQDMLDRVTQHKALKHLRCVQQGRVVALPLYAIYSSGVRTYDGIKIIATGMYPDLYKEK